MDEPQGGLDNGSGGPVAVAQAYDGTVDNQGAPRPLAGAVVENGQGGPTYKQQVRGASVFGPSPRMIAPVAVLQPPPPPQEPVPLLVPFAEGVAETLQWREAHRRPAEDTVISGDTENTMELGAVMDDNPKSQLVHPSKAPVGGLDTTAVIPHKREMISRKACLAAAGILILVFAAGIVVGLCGSGSCRGSSASKEKSTTAQNKPAPVDGTTNTTVVAAPADSVPADSSPSAAAPTTIESPTIPSLEAPSPSLVTEPSISPVAAPLPTVVVSTAAPMTAANSPVAAAPSIAPVPTASSAAPVSAPPPPSIAPVVAVTSLARSDAIVTFINSITLTNRTIALPTNPSAGTSPTLSPTTLEGRPPAEDLALQWLIRDDPLQLLPDTEANKFRLTQRYAILTIWFQPADYDEAWVSTFGWLIPDEECKWYGMTCVDTDFGGDLGLQQEITGINMGYNNVHGTISSELGLLTHLESFVFTNSGFHGTIPDSLGLWTRLQTWDIRNSELTGTIPLSVENWTQIVNLYWTGTLLTGTVPRNLCKASTLYYHIADCPTEIICICCYNCPY